jgi:hypothetical protein
MMEMEGHENETQFTKRVVLPSGKTIEVVLFGEEGPAGGPVEHSPAEPAQDLHVCLECSSELVYPVDWDEAGPENWNVLLHCPNCDVFREGVFAQDTVDDFDERLDIGTDALTADLRRLTRANMAAEVDLFVAALEADAILAEDF